MICEHLFRMVPPTLSIGARVRGPIFTRRVRTRCDVGSKGVNSRAQRREAQERQEGGERGQEGGDAMVLPANAIVEALELSMNELVFAGREPRSSLSFIFLSAFMAFLACLTPIRRVTPRTPCLAPSHPPAAGARSAHTHDALCRPIPCPGAADPDAGRLLRPASPAAAHLVLNEQSAG